MTRSPFALSSRGPGTSAQRPPNDPKPSSYPRSRSVKAWGLRVMLEVLAREGLKVSLAAPGFSSYT